MVAGPPGAVDDAVSRGGGGGVARGRLDGAKPGSSPGERPGRRPTAGVVEVRDRPGSRRSKPARAASTRSPTSSIIGGREAASACRASPDLGPGGRRQHGLDVDALRAELMRQSLGQELREGLGRPVDVELNSGISPTTEPMLTMAPPRPRRSGGPPPGARRITDVALSVTKRSMSSGDCSVKAPATLAPHC